MITSTPDSPAAVLQHCRLLSTHFGWLTGSVFLSAVIGMTTAGQADDTGAATDKPAKPRYPLAIAVDGDAMYVVDLDLPGVWKVQGAEREIFIRGSKSLRKPLNRPRCIAMHPEGGILVGDSATREVYHIAGLNAEPKPLSNGKIGIAMAIAVSPDGQAIYIGDAEKRSVFRMPIGGGEIEAVASVNARGLAFDGDGLLWAVTPDDAAIHRIDVSAKTSDPVVTGRPYEYPNGLVWAGEYGLVTDGYGKSVWKFTADGKTEPWFEGAPLLGPVGIAIDESSVWIADPKKIQVFQFDRVSKEHKPRLSF